jgi:citrate synthase
MPQRRSVAQAIGTRLGLEQGAAVQHGLDAALVIAADHELNPATFAARVAASGSADLHACIGAALHTHYGTLVGRSCDRLEALFPVEAGSRQMLDRMARFMAGGRQPPGFDHPLYPAGDPRGRYLTELAFVIGRARPAVRNFLLALREIEDRYGMRPTIECGLVALCRALGCPAQTASGLYALGRTAGWVAHVLEQRLAGFIIRPRARFIGVVAGGERSGGI